MELGLDVTAARVRAAVTHAGAVIWHDEMSVTSSWSRAAGDLLQVAERAVAARVDRVGVAIVPTRADLDFDGLGLIRLAAPAAACLAPLSGWPVDLAGRLAGRVRVVRGAAGYLGAEALTVDDDELRSAAADLGGAGVSHVAIAAAGALAAPEIERHAARRVREFLPGATVSLSADGGGIGLRERENALLLDGALRGWARGVLAALRDACGDRPLVLMRGGGGAVGGDYFARHPLGAVESRFRAAVDGALSLSAGDDLIVVFVDEGTASTIGVSGAVVSSPDLALAWGIRHNHQPMDRVTHSDAVRAQLETARLARRRPAHEVVVVGDESVAVAGRRPAGSAWAVAVGASSAEISVRSERLLSGDVTARGRRVVELTEETRTRLVRAGAMPGGEVAIGVESAPVAYVPDDAHTVRIIARERRGGQAAVG